MTPEATYSAMVLIDRWAMTVRCLLGDPMPEPPPTQGRIHQMPPPSTVEDDERDIAAAQVWRALAEGEGSSDLD
jgi:hypothetical protein